MSITVNTLQKAGAKKKTMHQYILENSNCLPTSRDVHNLVSALKKTSLEIPRELIDSSGG
ncbi:hypothetical protein PHMEG_00027840 [Phytophthora megakarya]|uniref:Uncharacterized protein n=1 Tax=Phytophthora megakarya TaxID=4795 RepID=A0A225V7Z2_9STRA|nr:hypothetical protein PHMEG_00027840 [Phytophthora megakarya]